MNSGELTDLQPAFDTVPVALVVTDLTTGRPVGLNRAAADLVGVVPSELVDQDLREYIARPDRRLAAWVSTTLARGSVDALELSLRLRLPRAAEQDVCIWARRISQRDRALGLWIVTPANARSIEREDGAAPGLVVAVTDHDWLVDYTGGCAHDQGSAHPLVGLPLLSFVHPSSAVTFLAAAARATANRRAEAFQTRLHLGSGAWTDSHCVVVPMCDHEPPRLGIVVTPVPVVTDAGWSDRTARMRHVLDGSRQAGVDVLPALADRHDLPELSLRQIEVLAHVVEGNGAAEIAASLYLSASTVRNHLSAIYRKFGVHSRAALLAALLRASATTTPSVHRLAPAGSLLATVRADGTRQSPLRSDHRVHPGGVSRRPT